MRRWRGAKPWLRRPVSAVPPAAAHPEQGAQADPADQAADWVDVAATRPHPPGRSRLGDLEQALLHQKPTPHQAAMEANRSPQAARVGTPLQGQHQTQQN